MKGCARTVEVAVLGAGPAGVATACALRSLGHTVTLFGRAHQLALEGLSLRALALLEHYDLSHAAACATQRAERGGRWGGSPVSAGHEFIVDRMVFDRALRDDAAVHGVCLEEEIALAIEPDAGGYRVRTRSGTHALSEAELTEVYAAFERLGEQYLAAALAGHNTGFSNLHQLMTDLHEGRRKSLPCGAGVGLLAVDRKGGLNLCHRFTGSELPTFGDVEAGIDGVQLGQFLGRAADRSGTHCATCRIRNLCAGGCYHESWLRYGDPHHRTYHYCDLLRRWVDFGIRIYSEIVARNPRFLNAHIEPRRAVA